MQVGAFLHAGPSSQHAVMQMDGNIGMDASHGFLTVHQNEAGPDIWEKMGIADIFDHDQDVLM